MKSLKSLLVVSAAVASSAVFGLDIPTVTTMNWSPNKSRYARGEVFTIVTRVTNRQGTPVVAGTPVLIVDGWGRDGEQQSIARWLYTDASGYVRTNYRVPTSPFADNVNLASWTPARWFYGLNFLSSSSSRRVPIG